MGPFFQRKPVRYFLTAFKWCRVTVLFAVLLVVAALAYLQLIGLPDFLKNPLLRTLRQRGFEAQFASARLGSGPSILIENAAFSPTNQAAGPRLSAGWTQLDLNAAALLHAHLQVDSFELLQARLRIPVSPTNLEPLLLTDGNLHIALPSTNLARLTDGTAWFRGIRIHLNGELLDFQSMRDWKLPTLSLPAPSAPRLTAWEIMQKIHFTGAPLLNLHFYAQGKDRNTLRSELEFTAASAQTPWGQTGPLHLRATCARLFDSGESPFFQARFFARDVSTPWVSSGDLSAHVDLSRDGQTNFSALLHLDGNEVSKAWNSSLGSNWVRVGSLRCDGTTTLPGATLIPDTFKGTLHALRTESGWGSVAAASLVLQTRRTDVSSSADPALGPWNQIKPFTLDWLAEATNILTPKLKLERVSLQGGWHPPQLAIDQLEAVMYRGHLQAGGVLDAASREVHARVAVDFDPHQISPLLTGPAQRWISLYHWESPPSLSGGIRFVLPPWTNRMNVWPDASRESIQLAGDFSVGRGAFRGLAVNSAQSHFSYTNRLWTVSGLRVAGPGGSLGLDYDWSERTRAYHFQFDSKLDPAIALPLLTPPEQRTLRQVSFSDPPDVHGEVWGNWGAPESTGFAATLATGPLVVRGEAVNRLSANLDFTNRFLRISQLSFACGAGRVDIPMAGIDFASNVFSMTNASSSIDPEPVRRALGEYAPPFMAVIHFDKPPRVTASGSFKPGDDLGTDMKFFVQGERFHWDRLAAEAIQGDVIYHVRTVVVTNVQAAIYNPGKMQGSVAFEWAPLRGTRFHSDFIAKDINLAVLARQWTSGDSKIEGMLDGHLALAAPYDASNTNLFGQGWLRVHNGLLWDIKLFGMLSPVLNAIAPGSGNSRARQADATFLITNGVISTDDLEIRSSGFRLLYRGTLDTETRLNARAEADLLRDTPVFGHFLSWMMVPLDKLFEYRVTGTLQKPVAEPLYIPKALMVMLRPFHTLKGLLPEAPSSKPAPAPSSAKEPH